MCSPTPLPRCSRVRSPIPSPPRWSPSRRRVSSGGWRSAFRTGSAPPAATASARACPSLPLPRWWPSRSVGPSAAHPTRTRGIPSVRCGRCWRCSTRPPTSRGVPHCTPTATAATHWPGGWPSSSAPTPPTGPSCCGAGERAARGMSTPTWRGSPSCGDGCARGSAAQPRRAARRGVRRAARRSGGRRPARAAVAVRAHPAGGTDQLAVLAALARTATCTCGSRTRRRRSGPAWRTGGGAAARRRPSADAASHPLLSSLGRDVRELQLRLRPPCPACHDHRHRAAEPPPRPCWAGCSATCRDDRASRPRPSAATRPVACRCTPATARTARSRCCARCVLGCWQTTPRWSRATSS